MAHNQRTTGGHGDSMGESAQWGRFSENLATQYALFGYRMVLDIEKERLFIWLAKEWYWLFYGPLERTSCFKYLSHRINNMFVKFCGIQKIMQF